MNTGIDVRRYRFTFNGQLAEDDVSGQSGSHLSAEFWMYDTRLGRRWNVDPVVTPNESPYLCFGGSPILYSDPNGDFKTKFGAWLYSIVHGGKIEKNSGGEYYVGKQVEYTGEGAGVAYQRRFDWKGRKVGRNLQLEFQLKQWKANNDWRNTLDFHGIEWNTTNNIGEARWSMLSLSTTVLLPNPTIKSATLLTNSTRIKAATRKELKSLIKVLSKPGSKLTQKELNQLRGLARQFGGTIRVDLDGVIGSGARPHAHVEGLGKSLESRHIWIGKNVK